ncbi:hypothetical protein F7725_014862 [Dissostichus mawsoni]|uniref:Uncharacterized protein n=1 Tax=Dissostichus mawsoni TaxID=36200 RepID=A0A7J5YG22_DISMA|nr:hypothetical protein F7725_014862 [Dissostichus mawsoni]
MIIRCHTDEHSLYSSFTCDTTGVSEHLVGEVVDDEGGVGHAGLLEVSAARVFLVQLLGPVLVRAFGNLQQEVARESPVDVEHSDERVLFGRALQDFVDVLHDPVEHAGVDVFGERIAGVLRLLLGHILQSQCSICCSSTPSSRLKCCRWRSSLCNKEPREKVDRSTGEKVDRSTGEKVDRSTGEKKLTTVNQFLLIWDQSPTVRHTHLKHHPGLLQQVRPHVGSDDVEVPAEADLDTPMVIASACINPLTSMMGLEARTFSSTFVSLAEPPTVAKKRMAYFAETVFPAPDSPLTMMD